MRWVKRGHVFAPDGHAAWARAYAFPPTPLVLDDELLRVYVASCDADTVGRVGYVDVRREDPGAIVRVAEQPVLDVGAPGTFDEHGVVPTCVVPVGDELWLYYTGYQRRTAVPYTQLLGLAVSRDGGERFERRLPAPVLAPTSAERTTRASAHVVHTGGKFVMHYAGGSGFVDHGARRLPVYALRRLESPDGVTWPEAGDPVLETEDAEHALARPWLLDEHRMLFSYRSTEHDYRIGLAVTADGETWERRDAGIDVSARGWDSDAVAYGATVRTGDRTFLLHCGNERGRTGFGYAELAEA
jgi:predicted GH43/DUF377 family glycosyl hydrolase